MKKLENVPCKYYSTWQENQSPLGSGLYWPETLCECNYPGEAEVLEVCSGARSNCPGYAPIEILICTKHDCEYEGVCSECEQEYEARYEGQFQRR